MDSMDIHNLFNHAHNGIHLAVSSLSGNDYLCISYCVDICTILISAGGLTRSGMVESFGKCILNLQTAKPFSRIIVQFCIPTSNYECFSCSIYLLNLILPVSLFNSISSNVQRSTEESLRIKMTKDVDHFSIICWQSAYLLF